MMVALDEDTHPQILVASFLVLSEYSASYILSVPGLHTKKANQLPLSFLVTLQLPCQTFHIENGDVDRSKPLRGKKSNVVDRQS